jgi:chemotaxis signal transduction protein
MPDLPTAASLWPPGLPRPAVHGGRPTPFTVLVCRAGGVHCAFAQDTVLEVLPAEAPAPLPGMAPPVLGLVAARGAVVPVFDLAAALGDLGAGPAADAGLRGTPATAPGVFVLLRDGARWAMAAVDAVEEVAELGPAVWGAPQQDTRPAGLPDPLLGRALHGGRRLLVLDTRALLRAPATGLRAPTALA